MTFPDPDKMTEPTKTITIELPKGFAAAVSGIDLAIALMMAYCGRCGGDINGHETKHSRGWQPDPDHWRCQECEVSYCDECVRNTTAEDDDRPDGLLCEYCAERDAGFQRCEGDECEHYRWGDEGNWVCHEGLGDKVMCPECDAKVTPEQRKKCGCDDCVVEPVDYKCRAEFPHDITRVREAWKKEGVEIESEVVTPVVVWETVTLPDAEWDISVSSAHTLDDLIRIAKTVTDCHTIVETLKRKEDYTGERTYGK